MSRRQKTSPEEQRTEMIRGMVDRLAERLSREGSDVEGWLRLVRAYMVLGERDKAERAARMHAALSPPSPTSCSASKNWSKVSG